MPRINLLPWREEERKKRQRDFMIAMAGSFVAAVVVLGATIFAFAQMIDYQQSRNQRLEAEIVELERSITEIDGLERQKERLLARMEIIEQLQRSRPEIVHLFDEITRQLPEGVYLNGMRQSGRAVELQGVAQSSLGSYLYYTGDRDRAGEYRARAEGAFARALQLRDDCGLAALWLAEQRYRRLIGRGIAQLRRSDVAAARRTFAEARSLQPRNHLAPYYLGVALDRLDDTPGAVAAFREALDRFARHADSMWYLRGLG